MQKPHSYKRCLRAAAFTLAMAIPMSGLAGSYKVVTGGGLNLRQTPEFTFVYDRSIEHGAHISKIIEDINKGSKKDGGNE